MWVCHCLVLWCNACLNMTQTLFSWRCSQKEVAHSQVRSAIVYTVWMYGLRLDYGLSSSFITVDDLYNVKELACSDELTENYFSDFPLVGSWNQNRSKKRVNIWLKSVRSLETWFVIKASTSCVNYSISCKHVSAVFTARAAHKLRL